MIAAVQEAIGVLVVSDVTVQDEKILRNIAIMYSEGVVNKYKVTDILFAHNVYVANSDFAVKQALGFLKDKTQKEPKLK